MGAGVATLVSARVFLAIPTDLERTRVLLKALDRTSGAPGVVVFGSSVAMCAVDATELGSRLPSRPVAYNLASTGQPLSESFLYFQELPDRLQAVVVMLSPDTLEQPGLLGDNVYNAFIMFGYRPTRSTEEVLVAVYGDRARRLLSRSALRERFESRWAVRQLVDGGMRKILRQDLDLAAATSDLFHPAPYLERITGPRLEVLFRRWLTPRQVDSFHPAHEPVGLLGRMVERTKERGATFLLALPPVHPRLRLHYGQGFYRAQREHLGQLDLGRCGRILDLTDLLGEGEFIDPVHPTSEGAARVTDMLAASLRESLACSSIP